MTAQETCSQPAAEARRTAAREALAADGPVAWLDADQQLAWRSFLLGSLRLREALNRDLEDACGLSLTEYEVLVRLSETPDHTLRMAVLADEMAYSRSRVTHIVRRMSDRGLVERATCSADGRGVNCTMTPRGYDLLVSSASRHVRAVRALFVDQISREDFTALGRAMARVAEVCREP